jgi:hypothetical protein
MQLLQKEQPAPYAFCKYHEGPREKGSEGAGAGAGPIQAPGFATAGSEKSKKIVRRFDFDQRCANTSFSGISEMTCDMSADTPQYTHDRFCVLHSLANIDALDVELVRELRCAITQKGRTAGLISLFAFRKLMISHAPAYMSGVNVCLLFRNMPIAQLTQISKQWRGKAIVQVGRHAFGVDLERSIVVDPSLPASGGKIHMFGTKDTNEHLCKFLQVDPATFRTDVLLFVKRREYDRPFRTYRSMIAEYGTNMYNALR